MTTQYDAIVIGTGPAGMAASIELASTGAKVLVLDEQQVPGGQIYRAIEKNDPFKRKDLGETYFKGRSMAEKFRGLDVEYVSGAAVWQVSSDHEVGYSKDGVASLVNADEIIIATGAQERPFPIQGWTLNGVMTAGAAQILLKESEIGMNDAVFVGTGPLLYLIVHQYLQAGLPVKAVIDLTARENYTKAISHLSAALTHLPKLLEGVAWKRQIKKAGVQFVTNAQSIRIIGDEKAEAVEYLIDGNWHKIPCDHVLLHQGVIPNVNMSIAAGCDKYWNEQQKCWAIKVDDWFQTSLSGISSAGDGASIGGGQAAEFSGRIAALGALARLGKLTKAQRDEKSLPVRKKLKTELKIRPFLDVLFCPSEQYRVPEKDDIVVCRCEEVTVGHIKAAVDVGCDGPNQLKSFSRCGMGPCQGRFCGLSVTEIIAKMRQVPQEDVGYYRLRSPVKPLLINELASMQDTTLEG